MAMAVLALGTLALGSLYLRSEALRSRTLRSEVKTIAKGQARMALSRKQQQVYDALVFLIQKGENPTVREIGALIGLRSPATVMKHLQTIESAGLISMNGKSRGIRLLSSPGGEPRSALGMTGIPLLGKIAAGRPLEAVPDEEASRLAIDPGLFAGSGELMALRVVGDSMIEAGILDGDCVVVRRQAVVEEGEVAAVEVDGEVTLKRWQPLASPRRRRRSGGPESHERTIHLVAANARFAPIVITAADHKEVRVLGKYVGLVRGGNLH